MPMVDCCAANKCYLCPTTLLLPLSPAAQHRPQIAVLFPAACSFCVSHRLPMPWWCITTLAFGAGSSLLLPMLPLVTRDGEVELITADALHGLCCPSGRMHAEPLKHSEGSLVRRVGAGTDLLKTRVPKRIV